MLMATLEPAGMQAYQDQEEKHLPPRVPSAPSTEQTKIVFAKEGCPWDVA